MGPVAIVVQKQLQFLLFGAGTIVITFTITQTEVLTTKDYLNRALLLLYTTAA